MRAGYKQFYALGGSKRGASFLVFLAVSAISILAVAARLVKHYLGTKIMLVCDNGRFHSTKAVAAWLDDHRDQIEI